MSAQWIKCITPAFILKRLGENDKVHVIIGNMSWLFVDKVVRTGVGLMISVWLARYLGPDQFGILCYATAFVALFATFASLGLDNIVIRDIVRNSSSTNEILGTAFVLKLIGGLATVLLSLSAVILFHGRDTVTQWMVAIIAIGTIMQAFDTIDFWFQSQLLSKYTVYAKNIAFLAIALLKVILIVIKAPLLAFALAGFGEAIIGAIGLTVVLQSRGRRITRWKYNGVLARQLLQDSWPVILSGAVITIYMKIDQVMLGNIAGNNDVGIYSAAVQLSETWYFIPVIISSSVYPMLITTYHNSKEMYHEKLKTIMGYFFWGALIFSVITTAYSNEIIHLLYGPKYSRSAGVLSIHIYSGIIVSMSIIFSQKFILDNTTKISFYGALFGAISNILLNFWLIPLYGAKGAAIATLISYVFPALIQTILFDRRIGLLFIEAIYYPFVRNTIAKISRD